MGRYSDDDEKNSGGNSGGSTRSEDHDSYAEEELESELEGPGDNNGDFPEGSYRYDRHEKKVRKDFASRVLERAMEQGWEMEELGGVLVLMLQELDLSSSQKLVQYLSRHEFGGDPSVLAKIMDDLQHPKLSSAQIIYLIEQGATQYTGPAQVDVDDSDVDNTNRQSDRFIMQMDAAFEFGLFDLRDTEEGGTLHTMYDMLFTTGTLTRPQLLRFCNCITSHCSSKDHVGSVLSIFTKDMSMQEAVTIVHGIVTSRAFKELSGTTNGCIDHLDPAIAPACKEYIRAQSAVNSRTGDVMESDEDSDGNLKDDGFLVATSSDSEELMDSEEEEQFLDEGEEEDRMLSRVGGKSKSSKRKRKEDKIRERERAAGSDGDVDGSDGSDEGDDGNEDEGDRGGGGGSRKAKRTSTGGGGGDSFSESGSDLGSVSSDSNSGSGREGEDLVDEEISADGYDAARFAETAQDRSGEDDGGSEDENGEGEVEKEGEGEVQGEGEGLSDEDEDVRPVGGRKGQSQGVVHNTIVLAGDDTDSDA